MAGSNTLLGSPRKNKRKSSSDFVIAPSSTLSQANKTIRLFIDDVSGRVKSLLKRKKSEASKLFATFLTKLATEENPIEVLSRLRLDPLSDFLGFLKNAQSKLSDEGTNSSPTYQLLTENLETTAQFLSLLVPEIEKNNTLLTILTNYVSGSLSENIDSFSTKFSTSETVVVTKVAEEQPRQKSIERNVRFGKKKIHFYKPDSKAEFGIKLTDLFSLSQGNVALSSNPTSTQIPNKKTTDRVEIDLLSPALRSYLKQIAEVVLNEVKEKNLSVRISDLFQSISVTSDPFTDLNSFSSLTGVSDFIEFSKPLTKESIETLGTASIEEIARLLVRSFSESEAFPLIEEYFSSKLTDKDLTQFAETSSHVFDAPTSDLDNDNELSLPLPQSFASFTEDLTLEGSSEVPTEADYIDFVSNTIKKALQLLIKSQASKQAYQYLDTFLNSPDLLTAIAGSEIEFFKNFAGFIGESWINQTTTRALLANQSEIVTAMVTTLQDLFPPTEHDVLSSNSQQEQSVENVFASEEGDLEMLEQMKPIEQEEEPVIALPDISTILSDIDLTASETETSSPLLPNLDNISFDESEQQIASSEIEKNPFQTSSDLLSDSAHPTYDYNELAITFITKVLQSLPNTKAGITAQQYLSDLLNSKDLLLSLATSTQRNLVEFANTLEQARLSNQSASALVQPLSEAVGIVAGELLVNFSKENEVLPDEDDDYDGNFSFSQLVPQSAFSQNSPSELDEALDLSDVSAHYPETNPNESHSPKPITPFAENGEFDLKSLEDNGIDMALSAVDTVSSSANDPASDTYFLDEGLVLDDSLAMQDEALSTSTLDDLKFDQTPIGESELDFSGEELLLPEDDIASTTSTPPTLGDTDSQIVYPTETKEINPDLATFTAADQSTPNTFETDESVALNLSTDNGLDFSAEHLQDPMLNAPVDSASILEQSKSIQTETEFKDIPQIFNPSDELNFDGDFLLDESAPVDLPDEKQISRNDLSDLKSLSAKMDIGNDEFASFGDTLDESFLTDSPMLLGDEPLALDESAQPTESELSFDLSTTDSPLLPTIEDSGVNAADFDLSSFNTTSLDEKSFTDQFITDSNTSIPDNISFQEENFSFDDTLSLDDQQVENKSQVPQLQQPVETTPKAKSSIDESYESELVPIGDFVLDELQQIFLDEAKEYIEKLNEDMLLLDKQIGTLQPDLVNRALRGAHTLKGSAAMVSLNNIRDLGHKMEDCLQVIRDQNLKVPRPLIDLMFKSLDAIGIMVENFRRTGEDRFTKSQPLIDLLIHYTKQLGEFGDIKSEDVSSVGSTPAELPEEVISTFEPDELQLIFLDEANEYLEKLNEDLLKLDTVVGTEQPELVNRVLRGSHTLKGSAAMVRLNNISELGHKMEDCLQVVRDGNLKVPRALLDVLFKSVDAIGVMLKKFRATGKDTLDVSHYVSVLKAYMAELQKHGEIKTILSLDAPVKADVEKSKKPQTFAEQTVRIDINSLNNLVNMSAELVISRNRLTNELTGVTKMINKFLKERNQLAQVNKKIVTTIQKNAGERAETTAGFSDVLKEFSDTEFDRFSDLDIISRDVRSAMLNLDETINELRGLGSILGQNVVKVSGIANDLNREIVGMRMVPMRQMYTRFQRTVRDMAKLEGKDLDIQTEGDDTKLDKSVMEEVVEPVMHMVRNAIGHGIEMPDVRVSKGKSPTGLLVMRAYQKGSRVILEIEDDGGGIPIEKVKAKAVRQGLISQEEADDMPAHKATELIFLPGFSTADKITELSGRGVGMDVVKNTIRQLKGTVNVETREGKGSKFIISLPLTLAINQALLVGANEFTYAIPLELVLETSLVSTDFIETDEDGNRSISIRGEKMQFKYLNELLGYDIDSLQFKASLSVVVIGLEDRKVAVAVEKLIGKDEIVVKSLGRHLRNVKGLIGATILGDGQVVVILDIEYLLRPVDVQNNDVVITSTFVEDTKTDDATPLITKRKRKGAKITVLHADDSPSVRKYVQSILKSANFEVISADDGLNALNRLPTANADLIVSDLEMPRMNGFEFVTEVRKLEAYKDIPFIIVTARAGDKHRRTGLELGANAFLNKPFDPSQLIETIENYIA